MLGERAMEIFVRLFIWILNRTYGKRGSTSSYRTNPMDEHVLREYDISRQEKRIAERQQQVVSTFVSSATSQQGAIDYADMQWEAFSKAVETPGQFIFCSGRGIAKVIEKRQLSNHQELLTLRRVIRRRVPVSELRDD